MPNVIPLSESARKDKAIREQLCGKMKENYVSSETMADILGVSTRTFYRLRNEPWRLTLREIRILNKGFPDLIVE